MPNPRIDLAGKRIGRWTVLELAPRSLWHGTNASWICRCDCGEERAVIGTALRSGKTQSCGCLAAEKTSERTLTHGHTKRSGSSPSTPEYRTWMAMRRRCGYEHHHGYALYGGRGITVCERWETFENFLADMGPRPSGKTLDRIDPDGNYEPDNCRWATPTEQARNRRRRS